MTRVFTIPLPPKQGRPADFVADLLRGALDGMLENTRQGAQVRITAEGLSVYVRDWDLR